MGGIAGERVLVQPRPEAGAEAKVRTLRVCVSGSISGSVSASTFDRGSAGTNTIGGGGPLPAETVAAHPARKGEKLRRRVLKPRALNLRSLASQVPVRQV